MAENKELTMEEELKKAGINQQVFEDFLKILKDENRLPKKDEVKSEKQNHKIIAYLKEGGILGKKNSINKDKLNLLSKKLSLEKAMKELDGEVFRRPRIFESTGGISPCIRRRFGSGGLSTCY